MGVAPEPAESRRPPPIGSTNGARPEVSAAAEAYEAEWRKDDKGRTDHQPARGDTDRRGENVRCISERSTASAMSTALQLAYGPALEPPGERSKRPESSALPTATVVA